MTHRSNSSFAALFQAITDNEPFPWQHALFEELIADRFPDRCDIPTGLGKTSIIAIWLLALAHRARNGITGNFPRRLAYVVNRRTVVDQATREAERMRDKLAGDTLRDLRSDLRALGIRSTRGLDHLDAPLAISTLRGQFADNAEWRADPARPAVIVGTIDMIGSRLLFAGYGCGFKSRPLHAGFVGQDTLLVHDEAHLEPSFQELILGVGAAQRSSERGDGFGRLRVMALTATSRSPSSSGRSFGLTSEDVKHPVVRQRIAAPKGIAFHPVKDKAIPDRIAELALGHRASEQAILIFVRTVKDLDKILSKLPRGSCAMLTGTMRGRERDRLRRDPIFARFDPKSEVLQGDARQGTVFLLCTSAGEVGIDISGDHLVCDLTPFDSMAQRFGRVNRYGTGSAKMDVVHDDSAAIEETEDGKEAGEETSISAYEQVCARTLRLLQKLPMATAADLAGRHDASPEALGNLPPDERRAAFTPAPRLLPLTEILLDAWAMTTIRDKLPGRPPVADWLHGEPETWDPPETLVAWRDEVSLITGELLEKHPPDELLDEYPLKPHELLRDRSDRVLDQLDLLGEKHPEDAVWIIPADGRPECTTLGSLVERARREVARNKKRHPLDGASILLSPSTGGLDRGTGRLDGQSSYDPAHPEDYDVSDEWGGEKNSRRVRLWDEERPGRKMRLVRVIRLRADEDEAPSNEGEGDAQKPLMWRWYVKPEAADDDGSRTAVRAQTLRFHLDGAEHFAREIVDRLHLREPEGAAVIWAARFHDLGKNRLLWQRSIGNRDPALVLAKSAGTGSRATGYRHELGSLLDVERESGFQKLPDEVKDLARHLIATHHGRARPHFPAEEVFDPVHAEKDVFDVAREVPRRFARLQAQHGRWGLAYLESLVRAADALASQLAETAEEKSG